jgi:hypothetical protein
VIMNGLPWLSDPRKRLWSSRLAVGSLWYLIESLLGFGISSHT